MLKGATNKMLTGAVNKGEASTPHPLTGLYCHKTSTDPELTRFGWNWSFQAHVYAVEGAFALLQYFSAFDGQPTTIEAVSKRDLLSGEWVFYRTIEEWRFAGDEAMARLNNGESRQSRRARRSPPPDSGSP